MIEIIWESVVKEESSGLFELAFGPGGAWSNLFAQAPGFRGATLLRDTNNPRRYLIVEVWDSEAQRQQGLAEHQAGVADLDAAFASWTESRVELGAFRMLAESAVRPRGKGGRRGPRSGR